MFSSICFSILSTKANIFDVNNPHIDTPYSLIFTTPVRIVFMYIIANITEITKVIDAITIQ